MLFMHNITRCNALTSAFMFYEQLINYLSPAVQIYGSKTEHAFSKLSGPHSEAHQRGVRQMRTHLCVLGCV